MAGYKTRNSWAAPDIQFDSKGRRIRPVPGPDVDLGPECLDETSRHGLCIRSQVCSRRCVRA